MKKETLLEQIGVLFAGSTTNYVAEDVAISPELAGMQIYDAPLVGIADAADEIFASYKKPEVIGPWFLTPQEWLPGAQSVISFFFPFTEQVRSSNRKRKEEPSAEWLHGRIEGQLFQIDFVKRLGAWLQEQGMEVCIPMVDERFLAVHRGNRFHEYGCVTEDTFGSNWSERHAAYACGLGTFGLSKGLITERGMAGRFASLIISEKLPVTERTCSGVYDACTRCGACVRRCPAHAISLEHGKDHKICHAWLGNLREKYAPRFGCGMCQTAVPCEFRDPSRK